MRRKNLLLLAFAAAILTGCRTGDAKPAPDGNQPVGVNEIRKTTAFIPPAHRQGGVLLSGGWHNNTQHNF